MIKWMVIALLAAAIVAACGGAQEYPYGNWQLSMLHGEPGLSQRPLTLELHNDNYSGRDGCNSFFGDYRYGTLEAGTSGDFFLLSGLRTEVGCPTEQLAKQADDYFDALISGTQYRVVNGQLEVLDWDNQPLLVFVREP